VSVMGEPGSQTHETISALGTFVPSTFRGGDPITAIFFVLLLPRFCFWHGTTILCVTFDVGSAGYFRYISYTSFYAHNADMRRNKVRKKVILPLANDKLTLNYRNDHQQEIWDLVVTRW
jgi:hypothetical protein